MFQTTSNLKTLREALSDHMELSEYFLGMHAFYNGEVVYLTRPRSPFEKIGRSAWIRK